MKINKAFILQKFDGKVTFFDTEKSELVSLNEVGSYIFEKLKAKWGIPEITKGIAKKYDISEEKAKKDVNEFIIELKKEKILIG